MRGGKSRLLYITLECFADLLRTGGIHAIEGIPEDGKLIRFGYDPEKDAAFMVVESESYGFVEEGGHIPIVEIAIERLDLSKKLPDFPSARAAGEQYAKTLNEETNRIFFGEDAT